MDKDKSIIAKFSEAMKGLADSAAEALKAAEPQTTGERTVGGKPSAGLLSDPLLVPPVAVQGGRRRKRAAKTKVARRGTRSMKAKSNATRSKQTPTRGKSVSGSTPGRARSAVKATRASARTARAVKAKATAKKSAKRPSKTPRSTRGS
jgi:hypothetical protein